MLPNQNALESSELAQKSENIWVYFPVYKVYKLPGPDESSSYLIIIY